MGLIWMMSIMSDGTFGLVLNGEYRLPISQFKGAFLRTWLATLLEGVNKKNFKVNFKKYILYKNGCFNAEKLVIHT